MDRWLLGVGACLLLASSLVAQQQQQQDEEGSGNGTVQSTTTSGAVSDYPGVVRTSVVDPDPVVSETFSRIRIRKKSFRNPK
jgi:hypothetical protein